MEQTWRVCSKPAEDFPHGGERELALALVNGADACFGRLFGRPHESVNGFLLIRVEIPVVVDLNELGIHVTGAGFHDINIWKRCQQICFADSQICL